MNNPKTVQALDAAHWQRQLEILIEKYQVPGAVFGILRSDTASGGTGQEERVVVGAGVTNINTGQPVTPDTLFQIGSITKTWTATLVLQLVAEGKLDLDAPIRDVLPDFTLSDESAAATITMRHLLTHTSGIDGDIFTDTGRGDDCVRKYVESLHSAAQLFTPGATWSYCNTGLVIAGRVVEVLREMTWDAALSKYILAPLSLKATTTLPEQTALHRFAVGHQNQNGTPVLTPTFLLPRSCGPAGLITAAADDVLSYARTFMPGGGQALLGADSLAAMLTPQVEMHHASQVADHMGIGWVLQSWGGVPTINHNGGTLGQNSMLRLFPEQGVVLFLAANGGEPQKLMRELFTEAAALLTGATMPAAFTPATDGDGSAFHEYEGFYEAAGVRIHIRAAGEATWHAAVMDTTGLFGEKEPDIFELAGSGPAGFGAAVPGTSDWAPLSFESLGDTRLLHFSGRSYPQIPTPN
ncbi:serine hydrolase [Arthrobacter sp. GMC3]|uniref:serine hydrolase domain-containing protein n=1 Tax=Arthrobacter sp. GMC3 TaxID=2058894 RepID=UPI0015E3183B|nr:serine hydrolase domain-containing protein [Arthrobacter sp. GMC3]